MPKKTRRQKKHADKARVGQKMRPAVTIISSAPSTASKAPQKPDQQSVAVGTHIKKDLFKTAFLALGVFALEILIFYATLRGISFGK